MECRESLITDTAGAFTSKHYTTQHRLICQGLIDPSHGVRAVACACLALCTVGDWHEGLPSVEAKQEVGRVG